MQPVAGLVWLICNVLRMQGGPAAGCNVLHASGLLADALVAKQTLQGIRAIFSSKVTPDCTRLGWSCS